MSIIDQTHLYVLRSEYEEAYLVERKTKKELWRTSFYGDAECGLISENEKWVAVAGEHLAIWKNQKFKVIDDEDLKWINDMRQIGDDEIEILTNPWIENPAIWKFNILTNKKIRIRDFNDYKEKEYTENVKW